MIVMLMPVVMLVPHSSIAELDGACNTCLRYELQGPIDRCDADSRLFFMNQFDQLVGRDMVLALEKNIKDLVTPRAPANTFGV
jgi:hypothetical protein